MIATSVFDVIQNGLGGGIPSLARRRPTVASSYFPRDRGPLGLTPEHLDAYKTGRGRKAGAKAMTPRKNTGRIPAMAALNRELAA
jgi:hypothetical protein